jgi:hypothetical protein
MSFWKRLFGGSKGGPAESRAGDWRGRDERTRVTVKAARP